MIVDGSPEWQRYIFYVALAVLIWEIWRGWRLGAVRGLLRLAALFSAWIAGTAAAGTTGTVVGFFSKVPPLLAPAVAGLTVAIGVYVGLSLLAGLLLKKTDDHAGVIRLGFGFGGAVCGAIFGLLLLWAGITLIRGMGALGELRVVQARSEGRSLGTEKTALFLIKLKESLELGITGKTLKKADPLPTAFYDDIVKISMVAGNQQAIERFLQYPGTLRILSNTNVTALILDPELERAAESRNLLPLLQNKHVAAAARDPELIQQLKGFDLTGALDYALTPVEPPRHRQPNTRPHPDASPRSPMKPPHATNSLSAKSTIPAGT